MAGQRQIAIEERRRRIRQAAKAALLHPARDESAEALSMRQIARDARLSVATLYNLFGSKEAILVDILATELEKVDVALSVHRASDPIERCRALVELALSRFIAGAALFRPLLGVIEQQGANPARTTVMQRYMTLLTGTIAAAVVQGLLRDDVPGEIVARQILWGFVQATRYWAAGDLSHDDFRAQSRSVLELGLLGIAAPQARETLVQRLAKLAPRLRRIGRPARAGSAIRSRSPS